MCMSGCQGRSLSFGVCRVAKFCLPETVPRETAPGQIFSYPVLSVSGNPAHSRGAVGTGHLKKSPTAAQGRVTSPWCGGVTTGGIPWANTQPGGRPSFSCGGWVVSSRAPPLAGHRGGATMAQGGLHRGGLAVCVGLVGLPVAQPDPRLVVCLPLTPLLLLWSFTGPSWATDSGGLRGGPHGLFRQHGYITCFEEARAGFHRACVASGVWKAPLGMSCGLRDAPPMD